MGGWEEREREKGKVSILLDRARYRKKKKKKTLSPGHAIVCLATKFRGNQLRRLQFRIFVLYSSRYTLCKCDENKYMDGGCKTRFLGSSLENCAERIIDKNLLGFISRI